MTKFIKLHNWGAEFILNIDDISNFCRDSIKEKTIIYLRHSMTYQDNDGRLVSEIYSIYCNETPEEIMKLIKEANND